MTAPKKAAPRKAAIKQRVASASAKIRSGGQAAGLKAAESVETFPVGVLLGGLALGAVVGALLPRTRQEEEILGSLGESINQKARGAATAAVDAGQAKLDELGISSDAAGKQVGKLIDSIAKVAETAGSAAVGAVRS